MIAFYTPKMFSRLTWVVLVLTLNNTSSCYCEDLTHEDLGFNTQFGNNKLGNIAEKAYSHRDWDADFIMNNAPISYKKPSTKEDLFQFEGRLKSALIAARQKPDPNNKGLKLLLEGGASFYQKQNDFRRSFELMDELVSVERKNDPGSEDLAKSEVLCAKAARSAHWYKAAESYLTDALSIYKKLGDGHTEQIADLHSDLYFLYTDMGKTLKSATERKECIRAGGQDLVAENAANSLRFNHNAWPLITTTLDSVATGQDLENKEKDADKEAFEQLKKQLEKEKQEREAAEKARLEKEKQAREKAKQERGSNNDSDQKKQEQPTRPADLQENKDDDQ